jgi:hypothetical protein
MQNYFYLLPATVFHDRVRPALTGSWQTQSFAPCIELCSSLLPQSREYREKCASADDEPLLARVVRGATFNRTTWKLLAGELLMYSAIDIPFLESSCDALRRILDGANQQSPSRKEFTAIQQIHFGANDLAFGSGFYRPEHAGYNDTGDVRRLADYLEQLKPEEWDPNSLEGLPGCESEADRADELQLVRDWLPSLRAVYRGAAEGQQIIVCETL